MTTVVFVIKDNKKSRRNVIFNNVRFNIACAKCLKTKQVTYRRTILNLVHIIGTKQHNDSSTRFHRDYDKKYHLIFVSYHFNF